MTAPKTMMRPCTVVIWLKNRVPPVAVQVEQFCPDHHGGHGATGKEHGEGKA